jgi:hypothetical protein
MTQKYKAVHKYENSQELCNACKKEHYYCRMTEPYMKDYISFEKNTARSRYGLYVHHDREDTYIDCGNPSRIVQFNIPFSVQLPENLTPCDIMQHLMIHVLVGCEHPHPERGMMLGIGGVMYIYSDILRMFATDALRSPWEINIRDRLRKHYTPYNLYKVLEYLIYNYDGMTSDELKKKLFDDKPIKTCELSQYDEIAIYELQQAIKDCMDMNDKSYTLVTLDDDWYHHDI